MNKTILDILEEAIREAVLHGREFAGQDIDYPVSIKAFDTHNQIIEYIESLLPKKREYGDGKGATEMPSEVIGYNTCIDDIKAKLSGEKVEEQ